MAEEELHHPQIRAVVDEVRGERVAQHVRRELLAGIARAPWRRIRCQNAWRVMPAPRVVRNSASAEPPLRSFR